ncbi:MAG: DUF1638 domain-containing protein [Chloroflexi bacterium]|nr:MAG: DUF1638 domain-containing protein [Chloroflexota bacterium]MBL1193817.1 DUF1638 domain-containing protein [Chloroflexota bacterium]NOH11110.1 DUF1638 domain-containing protein [Chloroflexota bacterium]
MTKTALISCGALGREVIAIKDKYEWDVEVLAVPVLLHNRPDRIPAAVQKRIREIREQYDRVIVVYGDCGTGGYLDQMLSDEGAERVAGPHCYEMYADGAFDQLMEEAHGTYFLTDYLTGSFNNLVIKGMGLDKFPELHDVFFKNYTRVVYLAQRDDQELLEQAQQAAKKLDLPLEVRRTGYDALENRLVTLMTDGPKNCV